MKDLNTLEHFPEAEKLTSVLMRITQNDAPEYFRILVAYYFCKLAALMRVNVRLHGRGVVPVNGYFQALGASGIGKTSSMDFIEEQVVNIFMTNFTEETFPKLAEQNLDAIACNRAAKAGSDPDDMKILVMKEYDSAGEMETEFDSGTPPAVKQLRHKFLMAEAGAINLEMDEMAQNLLGNIDILNVFLELYDTGKTKSKLIKNSTENKRFKPIKGKTPTNMIMFGTPANLLMPGSKEDAQYSMMLEIGYARRCFFAYCKEINRDRTLTPLQKYDKDTDSGVDLFIKELSIRIGKLADPINHKVILEMSKDVALLINEYEQHCGMRADLIPEYSQSLKAEMEHRASKTVKLAGAYAFIDGSPQIKQEHIYFAIKLAEDSGDAFRRILERDKHYETLAKFIVNHDGELTMVDLMENLPFFRGNDGAKKEMMLRAIEHGYKNNMIIKKTSLDFIDFYSGEAMEVTDLNKMTVAYSKDMVNGYIPTQAPFKHLQSLIQANGYHYTAHHFKDGYRDTEHMIPGFNLVILDVDGGINLSTAKDMLLKDYTAIFATTKRHTATNNRFRIILPLSHTVRLDAEGYSKFMENVHNWLPFAVDTQTKDCARKWESHKGSYYIQKGELLDALKFIPNTRKEEEQTAHIKKNANLSNLERWFLMNVTTGNRNNQLIRYGLALVDSGKSAAEIRTILHSFNKQIAIPLLESEINQTIMISIIKAINLKNKKP